MPKQRTTSAASAAKPAPEPTGSSAPVASSDASSPSSALSVAELGGLMAQMSQHGIEEVTLEVNGAYKLQVRRQTAGVAAMPSVLMPTVSALPTMPAMPAVPVAAPAAAVAAMAPATPAAAAPAAAPAAEKLVEIRSPMVGTFYAQAEPGAAPFVKVGSEVEPDTVVCIIDAMKTMNEIRAEVAGTIAKILVRNAEAVEFNKPLFQVKPK